MTVGAQFFAITAERCLIAAYHFSISLQVLAVCREGLAAGAGTAVGHEFLAICGAGLTIGLQSRAVGFDAGAISLHFRRGCCRSLGKA